MAASLRNVYISFVFIALGGLLVGYVVGITGDVVTSGQLLCPEGWPGAVGSWTSVGYDQCYTLDALQTELLLSLNIIGAFLSSLFCFRYADSLGRKLEIRIAAAMYLVGAVLAAASPVLWGVYVGFTIYGLGIGFSMHAAPVYIAEVSPAQVRGMLVSAVQALVSLGMFLGFFVGFTFSGTSTVGWRMMVAVSAAFALVMGVGAAFIPQSPRFLVLRAVRQSGLLGEDEGLMGEARAALAFFRHGSTAEEVNGELTSMRHDVAVSMGAEVEKCTDAFNYPRPLLIGCGLVFLQQVTGQPSVLFFATHIFKVAGFGSSAALSSVGVGFVKLLATLFTVWKVDQFGRRFLLFVGIGMMAAALAVLGTAFIFRECQESGQDIAICDPAEVGLPRAWALATVTGLMVYVTGFQVGFGPISWLMISEVFPLRVRGAALSLAATLNFGCNVLVMLMQGVLRTALTPAGLFFSYLGLALVSLLFVKAVVPETKGRTLEEIEALLAGSKAREARLAESGTSGMPSA